MESSRVRTWAEAAGLIAVVVSLVFVGFEIRQNSAALRAATAQSMSDASMEFNLAMADPAAWAGVIRMAELDDLSNARREDRFAVVSLMRWLFQHWSSLHWHYLRGDLDRELWDGVRRDMKLSIADEDSLRLVHWAWDQSRPIYHEEFQRLFDQILVERPAR